MANPWGKLSVQFHQRLGFSKALKALSSTHKSGPKSVFFPGCALMAHSPNLVEAAFDYLRDHLTTVDMMSACCGKPTYILGERNLYQHNLHDLEMQLRDNHVEELIVGCQNCFVQFKRAFKDIAVVSLWEIMAKYGVEQSTYSRLKNLDIVFSLHDPCPTRKEHQIHEGVRKLLGDAGIPFVEFEANRDKTLCCGAGNMLLALNPPAGQKQAHKRAGQAPTDAILTYCQSCVETFRITGTTSIHVLELIFDDSIHKGADLKLETKSLLAKWQNRFEVVRRVKSIK